MRFIEEKTCIRFIPRTTQSNYIRIRSISGCYSYLGMIGGAQDLSLDVNGCLYAGIIAHELIHALGFRHEQSRPDRDSYINVMYENISPNNYAAFDKYTWTSTASTSPYDLYSIMHYDSMAFSSNNKPTIVPQTPYENVKLIHAAYKSQITDLDAHDINSFYQC